MFFVSMSSGVSRAVRPEIGFLTSISEHLFRTWEERVQIIVDEIMEKMPDAFAVTDLLAKCEKKTPYILVCFQECERMNNLTTEIKRSLRELDLGLKGELTMTQDMEELSSSLYFDQVRPLVPDLLTAG